MATKLKIEKRGDEILIVHCCFSIEEISIFSNNSNLDWRAELSDTTLKGTHPRIISARFGLIWFSGFRGEDLNVIFFQNMPNLHNRYKSAERNISQKNPTFHILINSFEATGPIRTKLWLNGPWMAPFQYCVR
jgi:hypothetical protein